METSKPKAKPKTKAETIRKQKKSAVTDKKGKTGKAAALRSAPSEDEIRIKAREIYNDRLTLGEHGTAESDWLKAEKLLTGKKK